uniref:Cadherin domain-containing protein n=1 Tax=Macrostomum lignano TaxID=282301 RepID=A0A1I8F7D7_9PLAT
VSTSGQKVGRPPRPPVGPDDCSVPENQPAGRAACYLLARGQGLRSQCRVAYQLVTTRPLDRESLRGGAVAATVSCADGGSSPRRTVLRLRVAVLDENDNPPNFTRPIFQMQLDEELEPGTTIGRVEAVDVDEWPALNYSLLAGSDPDAEVVSVDSRQRPGQVAGSIRPRDARPLSVSSKLRGLGRLGLDGHQRELGQVMASDGVHAATALVELTIADVNDHAPEWVGGSSQQLLRVRENSPANTPVGRVSAIDRDSGDNGRVAYAWSRTARPAVRHPADGGEVYADSAPEHQPDDGGADRRERQLTAAAVPQLRRQPDRRLLPAARRRLGGALRGAADSDEGDNARLSFGIGEGPWREHFSVDAGSGNLTLAKPLTCATSPERISLRVSAKDHGRPPRFTAGALFIDPEEPPTQLVPPQPPQSRRRPEADRAGGPAAAPTAAATKAAGMAAWAAAGAGRGPGPGG